MMPKVTYIGDEAEITEGGITFTKGKAVQVSPDHPRLAKFQGNPTFAAETAEPPSTPYPGSGAERADRPEPGPLDQSVEKLTEYLADVDDADEIDRLIKAEEGGKSRVGALAALEARKDELAGA